MSNWAGAMADANSNFGNRSLRGDCLHCGGLAVVHYSLIFVQLGYGGANVLNKVALTNGVNTFVFAVYRDFVALAILIPTAYFLERKQRKPLTFSVLGLMLGSGLTGVFGGQCLQFIGLSLSSVSMAAAMPISVPVFTFIISVLFRMEKIDWKTRAGKAKALAITLTISGAVILCTVKGAAVLGPPRGLTGELLGGELTPYFRHFNIERWQLGGIYILLGGLSYAIFIVLQAPVLARYPAPISLTAFSYFFGSIMLALTGLLTIKDSSSWVINKRSAVIALVYAGIVSSAINFTIQAWAVQRAGPLLVAFYIPLQSFAGTVLAHLFLRETIFLGSILGPSLICTGLYLITCTKAKTPHDGTLLGGDTHCSLPSNVVPSNQINLQEPLLRSEHMPYLVENSC